MEELKHKETIETLVGNEKDDDQVIDKRKFVNKEEGNNTSFQTGHEKLDKKLNYAEKLCAFYVKKPKLAFGKLLSC